MNDWVNAEQHVERAHEHFDAGRWEAAESELRQALHVNPYNPEWHFNLGLTLDAAGRQDEALAAFAESYRLRVEAGGTDAHAALMASTAASKLDRHEDALRWLDLAEEAEPGSPDVASNRIETLASLGKHEEAEEAFYLAQQHNATHAPLYVAMSRSLFDRRLHEKAVWCLREAARLDPDMPGVQAQLAEAYAATGRLERARQLYLLELRADPGDVDTLMDLGDLLVDMHRTDEAAEKYRRVLELEPDWAEAHAALGDLAERRGDAESALTHFDVVLRLDPEFPATRRRLASLLLARDDADARSRARDMLRIELRTQRETPERHTLDDRADLGRLLLDAGMPEAAADVYRALLEAKPGDHLAHHHLSVALFDLGQLDEGSSQARQALVFEPRFVPAMHNLAVACMRRGEWGRARSWVRRAVRTAPEDPTVRRLRLRLRLHTLWVGFAGLAIGAFRVARWAFARLFGRPRRAPAARSLA